MKDFFKAGTEGFACGKTVSEVSFAEVKEAGGPALLLAYCYSGRVELFDEACIEIPVEEFGVIQHLLMKGDSCLYALDDEFV